MFEIKVYKYDSSQEANGYRGQEFSNAILQGCEVKEDITQEMDTAEITLCGQTFQEEFLPQTKFIIDFFEEGSDIPSLNQHWVVQKDMVEQPILSDDHYFDHHISLIEPSIIAQQRVVDNISVTYKLKDVSLEEKRPFDFTKQFKSNFNLRTYSSGFNFGVTSWEEQGNRGRYIHAAFCGKYFKLSDNIKMFSNGTEITDYYVDTTTIQSVYFKIPKMGIYAGQANSRNYNFIGNASIDYLIEEINADDETQVLNSWSGEIIENNALGNRYTFAPTDINIGSQVNLQEWIEEDVEITGFGGFKTAYLCFRKYTDTSSPYTPDYNTQTITINPNCLYKITVTLHEFPDSLSGTLGPYVERKRYSGNIPSTIFEFDCTSDFQDLFGGYAVSQGRMAWNTLCDNLSYYYNASLLAYVSSAKQILLKSSTPYSALALLQKAILNSNIFTKQSGVYIADVNNSSLPFIIDNAYIDKLSATSIIENFYNQKNLWEIMIDVGHYIHAIPELRFGEDDKFIITFNELGRTDEQLDNSTKVSIFNSRGVEDYISSTSSYVTNMVQLGGQIREWVAPKTSSENLLVSNDTAEIQTSKPIIELLQVRAKKIANNNDCGIAPNATADITNYIYEENVYSLLSIDAKVVPNRGIAMYYKLGTNKIIGGDYQLPQENPTRYSDYAFKKIIYSAFRSYPATLEAGNDYWKNLKINDFIFYVRYRTKDSVRQTHSRPDLRKYLLNSKYDKYPEHNQFNNQQDILVDSEKFGNNIYGKLIKTGNSTYDITEWNNSIDTVKHKGELYRINGELYYVAKVTHYWYSSCIISQVTYSKDYNELSAVIGIPSEPRFYEISEQSSIAREVSINEYMLLTDNQDQINTSYLENHYITSFFHIAQIIFADDTSYARYALTVFKGDSDTNLYNQTVGQDNLFKEILTPINAYSSGNTLTYEWDMKDNYSAGDMIIDAATPSSVQTEDAYKSLMGVCYTDVYGKSALMDFFILGNVSSYINDKKTLSLPISPINTHSYNNIGELGGGVNPTQENLSNYVKTTLDRVPLDYDLIIQSSNNYVYLNGFWINNPTRMDDLFYDINVYASNVKDIYDTNYNSRGLGLLKDCREQISINYNLELITSSDTFVTSPFLFKLNKKNIKLVFLRNEINKLSDGYININDIIQNVQYSNNSTKTYFDFFVEAVDDSSQFGLKSGFYVDLENIINSINNSYFTGEGDNRIKAIAIIFNTEEGNEQYDIPQISGKFPLLLGRNIPSSWTKQDIAKNWYFGGAKKNLVFTKKQ